jgi:tetratricopeptide (TPR) repeat protein
MGKSRLLREVRTLAVRRGFDVRWGTGIAESTEPLFLLRQTASDLSRLRSPGGDGPRWGRLSRQRKGRSGPDEPVDSVLLDLLREWESSSEDRPLLLLLDDLQWSDAESLRGFRLLVPRVHLRRWVVLAAARTGPTTWEGSRLGSELGDAARSGLLRHFELPPLSEEDRTRLAALVLGEPIDVARRRGGLRKLLRSVGGTPYYLVEALAALSSAPSSGLDASRDLPPERSAHPRVPAIPTVVAEAIYDRYQELPLEDRRLLDLAAYLGREFDVEALAVACALPAAKVVRRLAPYARFGWPIRATDPWGRGYTFDHDLLHSVVLDRHRGPERRTLLRLIPWWSERRPSDRATEIRLRTAVGDHLGALRVLEIAVDEATRRGAYRSAVDLLDEVPLPPRPSRAYLDRRIALQTSVVQRLRAALEWEVLDRALEGLVRLPIPTETAWLARCWGLERMVTRSAAEAARELDRLRQELLAAGRAAPAEAWTMWRYLEGLQSWSARQPSSQRRRLLRTIALLGNGRHDYELIRLRFVEAQLLLRTVRVSECARVVREVQPIVRRRPEEFRRLRAITIGLQADVALQSGDGGAALRFARKTLVFARRGRRPLDIAWGLQLLAGVEFQLRLSGPARTHYFAAEEIFARFDSKPHRLLNANFLGWCCAAQGDWAGAHAAFEEAHALLPGFDRSYLPQLVGTGRALVRAIEGDTGTALRLLPSPQRAGRESSAWCVEYWCSRSRVLEIAGDLPGSRRALERAWANARRFGVAWDQLEATYSFAEWARRQGLASLEARWRRRFARVRYAGPPSLRRRWRGISTARVPSGAEQPSLPRGAVTVARAETPLRARIVAFLNERQRVPVGALPDPARTGTSERAMADGIGVPRSALARSLGRLLETGQIERRPARLPGSQRRVYLYRTTGA